MRLKSPKQKFILVMLFCLLVSVACLMVNSNFSPFYAFHEHPDVHYFLTTTRCMLRGDVLYRDIYEQKGPVIYFLYTIGLLLSGDTFYGVFAVEILFFTSYLYFAYRTTALYLKSTALQCLITAITGMVSASARPFCLGGQCEEFVLPLLMIPIYLCLKYLRQEYPAKIRSGYVLAIGVCFALVFWMKYTTAGLFGGLVLFVVFLQIRDRQIKLLFRYILQFLAGFLIGSAPVILYFAYYQAFDSLFQVYFYNLIFVYAGVQPTKHATAWMTASFYSDFWGFAIWPAAWIACAVLSGKRIFSGEEKAATVFMLFWEAFGINLSYIYIYSKESLYVFTVLGLTALAAFFREFRIDSEELERLCGGLHSVLTGKTRVKPVYLLALLIVILLNREFFLPFGVEIVIAVMLVRLWNRLPQSRRASIMGYLLMLLAAVWALVTIEYDFLSATLFLTILIKGLDDLSVHWEAVKQYLRQLIPQWQSEYRSNKKAFNAFLIIMTVAVSMFCMVNNSANTDNLGKALEDFPQYTSAQYILENGGDDPVILYLDIPDPGIYWLTGTYPPEKYFGSYNIDLPEKDAIYEDYEENEKADYVIAVTKIDWDGYELVDSGTSNYGSYYLYEKIKISAR